MHFSLRFANFWTDIVLTQYQVHPFDFWSSPNYSAITFCHRVAFYAKQLCVRFPRVITFPLVSFINFIHSFMFLESSLFSHFVSFDTFSECPFHCTVFISEPTVCLILQVFPHLKHWTSGCKFVHSAFNGGFLLHFQSILWCSFHSYGNKVMQVFLCKDLSLYTFKIHPSHKPISECVRQARASLALSHSLKLTHSFVDSDCKIWLCLW